MGGAAKESVLRKFGVLPKSGMGVSPVSAWNRKDGRDARPTLSVPSRPSMVEQKNGRDAVPLFGGWLGAIILISGLARRPDSS